jgi:GT2 family glycosyltransferase
MISVIINTKDRLASLCACVKSIINQEVQVYELIIVDASSDYSEHEEYLNAIINNSNTKLKFLHTKAGNSFQRNVGINNLSKESQFVCFLDDDVVLYRDVIRKFIDKFHEYPEVVAVQGIEVNIKTQNPLGKLIRMLFLIGYEGRSWRLLPSGEHVMVIRPSKDQYICSFITGFTCIRKEILDLFRFDEWFQEYAYLEDYDFSFRIGKEYKMLITPEIKIIHNRSITSRLNTFKTNEMFIINKSYFFFKNIQRTMGGYLAYAWSLIGHIVLNFGKSIYKFDAGYFWGTCSGIIRLIYLRPKRKSACG